MLHFKFIYTINIGFYRCCNDIRICSKTIIGIIVVFNLPVDFTNIIGSFINSLDGKFFQCHFFTDNSLQSFNSRIYRPITRRSFFKTLPANVKPYTCNTFDTFSCSNLQIIKFNIISFCTIGSGKSKNICIRNFFYKLSNLLSSSTSIPFTCNLYFSAALPERAVNTMELSSNPTSLGLIISYVSTFLRTPS